MIQEKYEDKETAIKRAEGLSLYLGKVISVIQSDGFFYVEDGDVFVRIREELIASYEDGKKLKS